MGFSLKLKKVCAGYYSCATEETEITISHSKSKTYPWEVVYIDKTAKEDKDYIIFSDFAQTKRDAECSIISFILRNI